MGEVPGVSGGGGRGPGGTMEVLTLAIVCRSNIELRGLSWGLRGVVIFVDQSRDDGSSADGS